MGRWQMADAAKSLQRELDLNPERTILIASMARRTIESAEIMAEILGVPEVGKSSSAATYGEDRAVLVHNLRDLMFDILDEAGMEHRTAETDNLLVVTHQPLVTAVKAGSANPSDWPKQPAGFAEYTHVNFDNWKPL